jgi:dCMP deaminase
MLIGLTGPNGGGKGEVAAYLKRKNFDYYSLSDVIREEIQSSGEEINRENLIQTGNDLRQRHGPNVLAQRILSRIEDGAHAVIDSIRNPAEVETLREGGHFRLVLVSADLNTRFQRMQKRGRENDPHSFDDFLALEEREASGESHAQNLRQVEALADHRIENEGTLKDLHETIDTLLLQLLREVPRPGWDQYFMNIAKVAASRSNCLKRKVAAIIVRDKRIISTGYNGTPRGTRNCNEGGCPRCNTLASSGTNLHECFCSHGEENAIVQAAYHGVQLTDSTLYSTFAPCLLCAKMIINSGIAEVVYNKDYPLNDAAFNLFKEAGVNVRKLGVT